MTKSAVDHLEVHWRVTGSNAAWSVPKAFAPSDEIVVDGLNPNTAYDFEARAVSACGAKSVWVPSGYTTPPVPANNVTLLAVQTQVAQSQADANAANAELANIANDNILSPAEKPTVMRDYSVITTEQSGIDAQAVQYGTTTQKSDYDNAISTLTAYLNTLNTPVAWNNKNGDTTITGTTFRGYFNSVYTTRQTLLNAIYTAAKSLADGAQSTASIANTTANTANANTPLVTNPNFADGLNGWQVEPGVTGWGAQNALASSPNPQTPTYVSYYLGSAANTALRNKSYNPCQAGDVVSATCQVACASGGGTGYLRIIFYNSSSQELAGGGTGNSFTGNGTGTSRATATAPAGSVYFVVAPAVVGYTTGVFRFTAFAISLGARSLDEVPDSTTRFAVAQVDSNKRALIDFTQGHINKTLDNVGDGATYVRYLGSDATGNRLDFSKGLLNKHLGNIPDNATSSRYAVANIDGNRRALVDFSQGAHLNKTQDYIGDGTTFVRTSAAAGAGPNVVANPAFTTPALASENAGTPFSRWSVSANPGNAFTFVTNSNAADPLSVRVGAITVPANSTVQAVVSNLALPGCTLTCKPGDSFWLGGTVELYWPGGFNPGLSVAAYVAVAWSDRTGAFLSNSARSPVTTSASGAVNVAPVTVVAPANAATGTVQLKYDLTAGSVAVMTDANPHYANFGNVYCRSISELAVPGSGQTIGDQRNLLPVTWAGVRSVNSTSPITYTYTWNAGAGLYNISVNVAAYTLYGGNFSLNYAASSLSGTQAASTTVSAYYYYLDPTSSGGSLALHYATDPAVLAQQNGVVFIGSASLTTPAPASAPGGGTGGGGGGFCVADDMWIRDGIRAGQVEIGDPFDCIDLPTAAGKHVRALQGFTRGVEECVRMITSDGCALVCSASTPFDLPDGRNTTAPHMLGEQVFTDLGTATVVSLALVGPKPVTRAHLGGVSYAAGADPQRRIYSHNAGTSKP